VSVGKAPSKAPDGRDETELERSDRNLIELLQEVRVVQTGIQILFGFLLTVAFQPKFEKLSSFQKVDYFATLVFAASTLIMLTAPTSWHRILFRLGDKEHLVEIANRFTLVGLATMALTVLGVVMLLSDVAFPPAITVIITAAATVACATTWCAMPLARRRALRRRSALSDANRLDPVLADRLDADREAVR
jgi:predicted membrane channel-forming protein YqfA (hemolysin III family)